MSRNGPSGSVAVTGMGVICSLGSNQVQVWDALMAGRPGIGRLDLFEAAGCLSDRAAQVAAIPAPPRPHPQERSRASRTDRLCLAAAREAVAQAGLDAGRIARFGVSLGASTAGMLEAEEYCRRGLGKGFDRAGVSRLSGLPTSSPADTVARFLGAAGPRLSNMTACASSAIAIGLAADLIRSGDAEGMIAGGGDALCRLTYSGFNALRLLDPNPCRPFDANRQGLTLGEGAGILILEDFDAARARGARVLAELVDYGASCDAHHMTAPHPEGRGAAAAVAEALARGGVTPACVPHVNAHGTGTPLNDHAEARALRDSFHAAGAAPAVTATKSMTGHLLGGAGAVEAVVVVLTLRHQKVPPTSGQTTDDALGLDIVHATPRELPMDLALSNSFGFGGSNASLLFRRVLP